MSSLSGDIDVEIKNVINYVGKALEGVYASSSHVTIKPKSISLEEAVEFDYGTSMTVPIQVLPAEAGNELTLNITSSSPSVVAVESATVITDANGMANVKLNGKLPGAGEITISIADTDIKAKTKTSVKLIMGNCEKVTSNIPSGTKLGKGTKIVLTTATKGAEIYYTLDKPCPCIVDSTSRIKYTGPIVLNEDVYIIAYAVKQGYEDSATSGFSYTIRNFGDINSDEEVDLVDVSILARYLAKWTEHTSLTSPEMADLNQDGDVDLIDYMILARHFANWGGYESFPYFG